MKIGQTILRQIAANIPAIAFLLTLILFWEFYVRVNNVQKFVLPAPSLIIETIQVQFESLLRHTWVTTKEIVIGFAIGNISAILLAIVIANVRIAERMIYPLLIASQTIPKVAIAPLLIIWFGTGLTPKVVITAVICFFPTVITTVQGLRSVDPDARDLLRLVAAPPWTVFFKLQLPGALPYMFSGFKVSITLAVIGAVVGEWAGASEGLGYLVMYSSQLLRIDLMFAALVFIAGLGMALFSVIVLIERKLSWAPSSQEHIEGAP
jgi:NitT/TauT family transport system permease protein